MLAVALGRRHRQHLPAGQRRQRTGNAQKVGNVKRILIPTCVAATVLCLAWSSPSWGSSTSPVITGIAPTAAEVGATVTISGSNLQDPQSVTFGKATTTPQSGTTSAVTATVPRGATSGPITVKTAFGTATSTQSFTVLPTLRLEGVASVASDSDGFCALLTSSGVDCWGYGDLGGLGNGTGARTAVPVAVEGIGGSGTLSSVKSIAQDSSAFCALTTGAQVACWGSGQFGQLGNGGTNQSDFPVSVVGVGGTGTLSGVAKVVGSPSNNDEFCALLTSGRVDCWGEFDGFASDSAVPVAIKAVGGVANLAGVTSLASDGDGFCARTKTGGVDCWSSPLTASVVVGIGGTGSLTGVTALAAEQGTYCALTTSGGADCWGDGANGQLGNGIFYTSGTGGSDVPVVVEGVGGSGALSGVKKLIGNGEGYSFCALLTSGSVDCWGSGLYGQLGDGVFYTTGAEGSAVPVQVVGLTGTGTLSGVKALNNEGGYGFCAVLTIEQPECWGFGADGELGDGTAYTTGTEGSAVPVAVGGKSPLNAVTAVFGGSTGVRSATSSSACALQPNGKLACWGDGEAGQLGNEQFYLYPPFGSPKPVNVVAVGSG